MDSKQFVKLCRDAGLLDSRLTATAADLAFVAKAKPLVRQREGRGHAWPVSTGCLPYCRPTSLQGAVFMRT